MNQFSAGGYATALAQVGTHREAEARILSRLNANLASAMARVTQDFPALIRALHENDRFWTHVANDLADDGNALPDQLRASLISIAGFVIGHSAKVRRGAASAQALVDVNQSIIRGLTANGGAR